MAEAVEPTVVVGVDPVTGTPYRAELNVLDGDTGEIVAAVLPAGMLTHLPAPGTPVMAGPVHVSVPFDLDNPVSVFAWLRGSTDVASFAGPDLTPAWDPTGVPEGAVF